METKKELSKEQSEALLKILRSRFEKTTQRHKGIEWRKTTHKSDERFI